VGGKETIEYAQSRHAVCTLAVRMKPNENQAAFCNLSGKERCLIRPQLLHII